MTKPYASSSAFPFVLPCMRYFVSHSILNPALRLATLQNVCSIYRRIFVLFGFPYLITAARFQRPYVNTLTVNAAILPRPRNIDNLGISSCSLCCVLAAIGETFPVLYFKNIDCICTVHVVRSLNCQHQHMHTFTG